MFVEDAATLGRHPADDAVLLADRPVLNVVGGAPVGIERAGECRARRLAVVEVESGVEVVHRAGNVGRDAEHGLGAGRPGQHARGEVEIPGADLGGVNRQLERDLIEREPLLGALALGQQHRVGRLQPGQPVALERHIHLAREEVGELARLVVHGGEQQPVPESGPVPAVVPEVQLDRAPLLDGAPHPGDRIGVGVGSLQEAAISPDDLLARVAGQAAERVVDEHDRIVGQTQVGDYHRHARAAHRRGEGIVRCDLFQDHLGFNARGVLAGARARMTLPFRSVLAHLHRASL